MVSKLSFESASVTRVANHISSENLPEIPCADVDSFYVGPRIRQYAKQGAIRKSEHGDVGYWCSPPRKISREVLRLKEMPFEALSADNGQMRRPGSPHYRSTSHEYGETGGVERRSACVSSVVGGG